jgi:GxxExxY protein
VKIYEQIPWETEALARIAVDISLKVHRTLGPGLLESVYEACLEYEFKNRGIDVKRQVTLPVVYEGITLDAGLKIDLILNDCVIIELKSVEKMLPVFEAQLLTYLKLTGIRLGLLINFNVPVIKDGIKRIVC